MAAVAPANPILTLSVPPVFNADSTTLPAVILGVDSEGRTTYAVEQDLIETGSTTIPLTATLVEAADYASYTFSVSTEGLNLVVGFDCDLENDNAICSGLDDSSQLATATLSSLEPFIIEVVSTAAGVSPTSPPSTSSPQETNKSQSSAPPSQSSTKPNSSSRSFGSISGALVCLVLVAHWLL
ncbi:hypothetical protein MSAN_01911400 [Mycena sanguinolenta]|uniref:Uncharacterized protein n=1 Tax=Mycena sanguinolenta TaxID=230812 RepID=A0A8H6XRE5_9AGAR|nr:hypothetical protein MSAN_01911400 [Mycena sanguinolenta]